MTDLVELYRRLPVTPEADWWIGLAASASDRRVLYVGCGTGRLALPLARACEELVGVDVEQRMLAAFAARLADEPELEQRVRLVASAADLLDLGERFGLVVLPSSLLNGIAEPAARTAAVRAAAAHCRQDGKVVLQVLNPYWLARSDPSAMGRLEPHDGGAPVDVVIEPEGYDPWEQRHRARIRYRFPDGDVLTDDLDAVALFPRELRALAYQAGLDVVERWGARPGKDPLGVDGGTWHLVCRPFPDAS